MRRWRNPFRKRWVVVLQINTPRRTHRREFGRYMTRTGADLRIAEMIGYGGVIAVVVPIPGHVAPQTREVAHFWSRGMAETYIAEREGRYNHGTLHAGQACAQGVLRIETLP